LQGKEGDEVCRGEWDKIEIDFLELWDLEIIRKVDDFL
jgi:hypothetical protein